MKTAIVTMVKDEQLDLEEWIQWHLALGFTNIFIYEDLDSTSHKSITDKYDQVFLHNINEILTGQWLERGNIQVDLINLFTANGRYDFDWITMIDADEFINIKGTLDEVLTKYDGQNLLIKWTNYGANGHITRPTGGLVQNYTTEVPVMAYDEVNDYVYKSIGCTKTNPIWGDVHNILNAVKTDDIYIKHYITKSFEDWCIRIYKRGDIYHREYRAFDDFYTMNPDIDKELCEKFREENFKDSQYYIQEYEKFPQLPTTPNITEQVRTIEVTFGYESEQVAFDVGLTGVLQIMDQDYIIGSVKLVDTTMHIFMHHAQYTEQKTAVILVINESGQFVHIKITQEASPFELDTTIVVPQDIGIIPRDECEAFFPIQAPKRLGMIQVEADCNLYSCQVSGQSLKLLCQKVIDTSFRHHRLRFYGKNGGEAYLNIMRD